LELFVELVALRDQFADTFAASSVSPIS
jgi:hypothetical protein